MQNKSRSVSVTGILAALSAILYIYPHFAVLPGFTMFKMDFADLPALLASTIISPLSGVLVVLIRDALHLFVTDTLGIGELSNFIISSSYVLVAGLIIRKTDKNISASTGRLLAGMIAAAVVAVVVSVASNFYIIIGLYEKFVNPEIMSFVGGAKNYIVAGVFPFNVIKAGINSAIFVIVYKALIPKIRRYI